MSQLRDDIKVPIRELSRSLINPQASDFDNLIHLLKYVNQTRGFVYVMDPQVPTADSQGFIPVVSHIAVKEAHCSDQRLARSSSESAGLHASVKIRRAFTPPPRRGSDDSDHSDDNSHIQMPIQVQEADQNVRNAFIQNVSDSQMVVIHSDHHTIMHVTVQCYQFITRMVMKAKQIIVLSVNVNQDWTIIMTVIDQRRRQVQRRNQSRQSRPSDLYQYLCTFVLFSVLFAICVFIVTRLMPFNPSSSHSSCLAAVSNSVESSAHSQVLRQLSTSLSASVATFISRMAASQQTSASAMVGKVAASVAKSIQSLTVAHAKHEEVNNDAQAQVICHALSAIESTQKDHEFQRVIEQVTVNTGRSRQEHLLKILIKAQMADQPQQWEDHSSDVRHFTESFKYFQGEFETLFNVSQGFDRDYIVLSESEFNSWSTYGWVKSPRVSEETSDRQDQVFHALHLFNRLGDAINHMYYLRVAHGFMLNSHVHGRYFIYSGTLRAKVDDLPQVSEEVRARILRIIIVQESMSATDEAKFKKVKLHQSVLQESSNLGSSDGTLQSQSVSFIIHAASCSLS